MVAILNKLSWSVLWRAKQRLQSQHLERLAFEVARRAPPAKTPPVVFFNASTRLQGMSLNAGFSLLAAWALRLAGTPVVQFACKGGMSRCVLGTYRDQTGKPPPCKSCIAQSHLAYTGAAVRWFSYGADPQVANATARLSLAELMN